MHYHFDERGVLLVLATEQTRAITIAITWCTRYALRWRRVVILGELEQYPTRKGVIQEIGLLPSRRLATYYRSIVNFLLMGVVWTSLILVLELKLEG